jgi:hypothetical protein
VTESSCRQVNTTTVELPSAALRAQLAPKTLDAKTHTVELTWTTGQRVLRYSALDDEPVYGGVTSPAERVQRGLAPHGDERRSPQRSHYGSR